MTKGCTQENTVYISKKIDGAQIANYTLHLAFVDGG